MAIDEEVRPGHRGGALREDKAAGTSRSALPRRSSNAAMNSPNRRRLHIDDLATIPLTMDPLIGRLDDHENVESWLDEVIKSRRSQVSSSALELKMDGEKSTIASPAASWSNLTNLEAQLASLSSTLSFARQDTLSVIDSTISTVNGALPKLGLELRLMRDASLTLRTNIDRLRQQALPGIDGPQTASSTSAASAKAASAALERLSALSTLHSRMSSARNVLSLAESWSTLSADVTSYLSESKYAQACSRLKEAKGSLVVFERTPEYESRKKLLDGLCNSLVASILPILTDAIQSKDLNHSQQMASLFAQLDRAEEFADHWRSVRAATWITQWNKAYQSEITTQAENSQTPFAQRLPSLLDGLVTLLNEERLFAPSLFPKAPRQSMELLTTYALGSLQPLFGDWLRSALQGRDQDAIIVLVQVHRAVREVLASISKVLSRVQDGAALVTTATSPMVMTNGLPAHHSPTANLSPSNEHKQLHHPSISPVSPGNERPRQGSHTRRMSNRRLSGSMTAGNARTSGDAQDEMALQISTSSKIDLGSWLLSVLPDPANWEAKLLEPLLQHQDAYATLEETYLRHESEKESAANEAAVGFVAPDSQPTSFIGIRHGKLLQEDFKTMKALSEDAAARSVSLTFGFSSDGLITVVDSLFATALQRFSSRFKRSSQESIEESRRQAGLRLHNAREGIPIASSVEDDQWKAFEESIGLLSILHACEQTVEMIEANIATQLADVAEVFSCPATASANDALLRLCGQSSTQGVVKSPLSFLVRHSTTRLQSSALLVTLEQVRAIVKETKNGALRRRMLFREAREKLSQQAKGVQRHLIDVTLAPLMSYMETYTQLPIWEATRLPGSVNEYELAMPTFSLSPTEEMSRIGEGLLDLPRLLEVWADNGDMRWALPWLPFVASKGGEEHISSAEAVEARNGASTASGPATSPSQNSKRLSLHASSPILERRTSGHRSTMSLAAIATLPASDSPSSLADGEEGSVLQTYLSSIALTLLSHLTSLVLPSINKLTNTGASQLVADLEYLLNILSALNVNSTAVAAATSVIDANDQALYHIRTLEAWKDSCRLREGEGKKVMNHLRSGQLAKGVPLSGIADFEGEEDRLVSLAGTQAFDMVAKMRSW